MKRLRIFVAIELPQLWRESLADLSARLRPQLPPARWVKPDQMHLTLAFFGAVGEERLADVEAALKSVCAGVLPIPLELDGGGAFPPRGRARVAWVGVRSGSELGALAERVREEASVAAALPREERPFRPHLTLARPRPPWSREASDRFAAAVPSNMAAPFVAREICLIESRLGAEGARYRTLATCPLESSA